MIFNEWNIIYCNNFRIKHRALLIYKLLINKVFFLQAANQKRGSPNINAFVTIFL